jgi:hypothetical protein
MCKLTCCRNCLLPLFLLLFHRRCNHSSLPNDVAARTTRHNNQFSVEAAAPTAPMPTMMLIVTLSEGYPRTPAGTKPYVFLCRTQPTTNQQRPLTRRDLNGRLRPPWCLIPGNGAHNSCPECWWIVLCGGAGIGTPWRLWDGGNRLGLTGHV